MNTTQIELTSTDNGYAVAGYGCPACGLASASYLARCPRCAAAVEQRRYGPAGTIWSFTTVRIPITGYSGDRTLTYVDLDDGPRVLCHLEDGDPRIGRRVRISSLSPQGHPIITGA